MPVLTTQPLPSTHRLHTHRHGQLVCNTVAFILSIIAAKVEYVHEEHWIAEVVLLGLSLLYGVFDLSLWYTHKRTSPLPFMLVDLGFAIGLGVLYFVQILNQNWEGSVSVYANLGCAVACLIHSRAFLKQLHDRLRTATFVKRRINKLKARWENKREVTFVCQNCAGRFDSVKLSDVKSAAGGLAVGDAEDVESHHSAYFDTDQDAVKKAADVEEAGVPAGKGEGDGDKAFDFS